MSTRKVIETNGHPSVKIGSEVFSSWALEDVTSHFSVGETVTVHPRNSRVLRRVCDVVSADGHRRELWSLAEQEHMTPRTGPTAFETFLDELLS